MARDSTDEGRLARVNGMTMYYEMHANGDPLLLLHGGLGFAGEWDPFIPAFSERFQVFALDSRGHARSDNPAGELSYRAMSDDVATLIEILALDRVSVVGNSDGAQIALELGLRYPQLIDRLVVCAGGTRASDAYQEAWLELGIDRSGHVDFDVFESVMGEETIDVLRERHASRGDAHRWMVLTRQLARMWKTPLEYAASDFGRIDAPVLLMLGDRDQFITVEENVEMHRALPRSELAVIPGSDHGIPFDNAELCTRMVLDFLQRHPIP